MPSMPSTLRSTTPGGMLGAQAPVTSGLAPWLHQSTGQAGAIPQLGAQGSTDSPWWAQAAHDRRESQSALANQMKQAQLLKQQQAAEVAAQQKAAMAQKMLTQQGAYFDEPSQSWLVAPNTGGRDIQYENGEYVYEGRGGDE